MNKWVQFVKEYASKNNISYSCAMSKSECKDAYRAANPAPSKSTKRRKKLEKVGLEPLKDLDKQKLTQAQMKKLPEQLQAAIKKSKINKEIKQKKKNIVENVAYEKLEEVFPDITPKPKNITIKKKEPKKEDTYPSLINELVRKSKELYSQVRDFVKNYKQKAQTTGTNEKIREKFERTKTDLEKKLNELRKIGRDKYGNLYPKEDQQYFTEKYGKNYANMHPTAFKDKYWNGIDLLIPIWEETEELLKTSAWEPEEPKKEEPKKKKPKTLRLGDVRLELKNATLEGEPIMISEEDDYGFRLIIKDGEAWGVYDEEGEDDEEEYYEKDQLSQREAYQTFGKVAANFYKEWGFLEFDDNIEGTGLSKACWKGYEAIGMKKKGKKMVPNCVPITGGDLDSIAVKKIEYKGKKYLKDKKCNVVYDFEKFQKDGSQVPVGVFDQNDNILNFCECNDDTINLTKIEYRNKKYFLDKKSNIVYDRRTNDEVGIYFPETKIIKFLTDEVTGGKVGKSYQAKYDALWNRFISLNNAPSSYWKGQYTNISNSVNRVGEALDNIQEDDADDDEIILNIKIFNENYKAAISLLDRLELDSTEGGALKDYGTAIIKGRNDYPPKMRDIIEKYGKVPILKMTACRTPVPSVLTSALNAVSLGAFSQKWATQPYDKLFHLDLRIELATRPKTTILLEKNEVLNAIVNPKPVGKDTECTFISKNKMITINQLLEGAKQIQGDKFFKYSAYNNNCQDFIMALLKGSGLGTQENYDFIKQDTTELFKGLPGTRKFANTITDLGAVVNTIVEGAGSGQVRDMPREPEMPPVQEMPTREALRFILTILDNDIFITESEIREYTSENIPVPRELAQEYETLLFNRDLTRTRLAQATPSTNPNTPVESPESSLRSSDFELSPESSIRDTETAGRGAGASTQHTQESMLRHRIQVVRNRISEIETNLRDLRSIPRDSSLANYRSRIPETYLELTERRNEMSNLLQELRDLLEQPIPTTAQLEQIQVANTEVNEDDNEDLPEAQQIGYGIHKGENYYVQSVVFDKNKFDVKEARKWLKDNKYVSKKPDITDSQIRFRQVNPKYIKDKGFTKFRTKKIGRKSGISLIISYK